MSRDLLASMSIRANAWNSTLEFASTKWWVEIKVIWEGNWVSQELFASCGLTIGILIRWKGLYFFYVAWSGIYFFVTFVAPTTYVSLFFGYYRLYLVIYHHRIHHHFRVNSYKINKQNSKICEIDKLRVLFDNRKMRVKSFANRCISW